VIRMLARACVCTFREGKGRGGCVLVLV